MPETAEAGALWAMVAQLVIVSGGGIFGPPPTGARSVAASALGLWLFAPRSAWVDRHREVVVR